MKCPNCNGKLHEEKATYFYGETKLGDFDAEVCQKCGEIFFTEGASDVIDKKAKELGVWGIGQEGKIGYSGNSIIVRVPKKIAKFLNFKEGKSVYIRPEGKKKLVVEAD